jgi:hypothetical protein
MRHGEEVEANAWPVARNKTRLGSIIRFAANLETEQFPAQISTSTRLVGVLLTPEF